MGGGRALGGAEGLRRGQPAHRRINEPTVMKPNHWRRGIKVVDTVLEHGKRGHQPPCDSSRSGSKTSGALPVSTR
jgi:hypothetical protein